MDGGSNDGGEDSVDKGDGGESGGDTDGTGKGGGDGVGNKDLRHMDRGACSVVGTKGGLEGEGSSGRTGLGKL